MVFIPLIDVLNISIILIMIIAFANSATNKLFQLVDDETIKDYNVYFIKPTGKNEIKMNIYEYNRTVYNLDAVRVPSSSVKSFDIYKNDFHDYCQNKYEDPEVASQVYNLNVLMNLLNSFFTCLTSIKNILNNLSKNKNDENQEMETQYVLIPEIIDEIKDILINNTKKDVKRIVDILMLKNKDTLLLEDIIEKISKKLDEKNEKLLYKCVLQFKNGVTDMNIKIGKYTKENISSIKKDKKNKIKLTDDDTKFLTRKTITINKIEDVNMKLTTQQKKKILEKKELEFLKYLAELAKTSQYFSLRDETQELYKTFTNIELINDLKDPDLQYSECKSFIFYPMEFKVTKLSYMIYPSSSENDLNAFKTKRNLFIKYLKIFSKSDNNEIDNNGIYDKYEKENNKMTKKYFDKLKTCRAIKGEKYKTYILRLKIIGCTPLPDSLWKNELTLV